MNRNPIGRLLIATGLLLCMVCSVHGAPERVDKADVRILIDISGSMKKNDPRNLRRPALRLLVGLLPGETRAGVWTFGQYVNMQIPLGKVDGAWKKRARAAAAKIGSPGQFTNIEDAIRRSVADWNGASQKYRRHLILLTDGMVDISKNPKKNLESRQRIIEQLLPRLKEQEARIHTIALSERADHELMQTLSWDTDGWYEQVDNADQLQRIFLRIFEKVGKPDTLPLKDNKFKIDSSVQEATLLVFRKEGAEPTRVVTPGGKRFSAEKPLSTVSWHRDEGYDLLTISKPETGEWKVQAAVDPDNRVMVVTDLKMKSNRLPNRFVRGEQLPLRIHFTNNDKKITRREFLEVVSLSGEPTDSAGPGEARPIYDDGQSPDTKAGDGDFTLSVGGNLAAGEVELVVRAQGKTFEREQRHLFALADPVAVELQNQGTSEVKLVLTPDYQLLSREGLSFQAVLYSASGEESPLMLLPGADGTSWEGRIQAGELSGEWTLAISVSGKSVSGSDIQLQLEPRTIQGEAAPEPEPTPQPEPAPAPVAEPETAPEPAPQPDPGPEPEPEEGWGMTAALFGGANLLLLILAGVGFWLYRRRKGDEAVTLVEEDQEEAADDSD